MQYTNSRIYQFVKTNHFLERQWNRGIPDEILYIALKYYEDNFMKNTYLILSSHFLENHLAIKVKAYKQKYLVISIKKNKFLITTFWTDERWLQNLIYHKSTFKIITL